MANLPTDDRKAAWEAACRLLRRREEELRDKSAKWRQRLLSSEDLTDIKNEVAELRELEQALFRKAFPGMVPAQDQ